MTGGDNTHLRRVQRSGQASECSRQRKNKHFVVCDMIAQKPQALFLIPQRREYQAHFRAREPFAGNKTAHEA